MPETTAATSRSRRSDARQNCERLVSVARVAFTEQGADASLIDIARRAGVSSGTLYRHFPTRAALLAAVYRSELDALAAQARELSGSATPLDALATWLRAFSAYTSTCRGLKGLLSAADREPDDEVTEWSAWWHSTLLPAATSLVERAQQAGTVRDDLTTRQVLRLVNAVALACEQAGLDDDPVLLGVIIDGLRRRRG